MTSGAAANRAFEPPAVSHGALSQAALAPQAAKATSLRDYVVFRKNVLSSEYCQRLIERFEASEQVQDCERPGAYRFSQLEITTAWPDEQEILLPLFLNQFDAYRDLLGAKYWPKNRAFEHLRIKRYLPDDREYFAPHVDVVNHLSARRFVTAFIYLNAPQGGETIFPDLDVAIAPETGKLLAFPPLWMFPHEARPPRGAPKYILHTYLCYGAGP